MSMTIREAMQSGERFDSLNYMLLARSFLDMIGDRYWTADRAVEAAKAMAICALAEAVKEAKR